ncbi:mannose-P-dolichol utilization defect 1 protein homolog 2 isoform X2 [Cryptomeria japonica]|uniref:mannose-P-dolichol utilization defect 1 protein homolog 2 isoform X2 n=1 Tax=Cryptomeria japonica TaxID=3369 RepID=UPI0027D9F8F8|nr:mannose-P-dolichol utilization defect 1 protein homolog 2 isoform X2 [Cryptomeria japonica]
MEFEILGINLSCVVSAISNGEFPQKDCALDVLSKALGYCIVAASIIVKVPQIYIIWKNKSIKGLSVASFELEVVGFTIALAYCLHNDLPFSAYGELLFLLLQALILIALIYYYSSPLGARTLLKSTIYCAVAPTILAGRINPVLFEALYASQHAIFLFARIPQIWKNYCNKSTGELSFLTSFMNAAGCIVRLFTSIQEKAPTSNSAWTR